MGMLIDGVVVAEETLQKVGAYVLGKNGFQGVLGEIETRLAEVEAKAQKLVADEAEPLHQLKADLENVFAVAKNDIVGQEVPVTVENTVQAENTQVDPSMVVTPVDQSVVTATDGLQAAVDSNPVSLG